MLQAWALRRAGLPARDVADAAISFIVLTYLVYMMALIVFGYAPALRAAARARRRSR